MAEYNTDHEGNRNVGRDYNEAQLAFVGDSFTWGAWLARDKTFPDLIESGLQVPIVNLAQQSYFIEQYTIQTTLFLKRYSPKVVVLCIFANDLTKPLPPGDLENFYENHGWARYREYPFLRRSFLYQLGQQVERAFRPASRSKAKPSPLDHAETSQGIRLRRAAGTRPDYFSAGYHEGIEERFASLLQLISDAGSVPVVFLLPSKESAYKPDHLELFGGE